MEHRSLLCHINVQWPLVICSHEHLLRVQKGKADVGQSSLVLFCELLYQ